MMRQGEGGGKKSKECLQSDAASVKVSMVLRDQIWICRFGSQYKNMSVFTVREGTGVETQR